MRAAVALLLTTAFTFACTTPTSTPRPTTLPSSTPTRALTPRPPRVIFPISPSPTITPSSSPQAEERQGPEGFIADIRDTGAEAEVADSFDGEPLASVQTLICVDREEVRVFTYGTVQERAAASSRIDPEDPTKIGTAIVEWVGSPRFWQRDRIIVLYLGTDESIIDVLTDLIGDPFAVGEGRPPPRPLPSPC
jgi:hypothetical protein